MRIAARYELLEQLYEGRTTTVFRAKDKSGSSVILKMKSGAGNQGKLRHEYSVLKELRAPGVVRALRLEEHATDTCLVLEDVGGEALTRRLARGALLSLREALQISADLAGVLSEVLSRKYTMFCACCWMILGSYLYCGASHHAPGLLYAGRFFT